MPAPCQAVNSALVRLRPTGTRYDFNPSQFSNIVVCCEGLPSGVYSEIVRPGLEWAVLTVVRLT